MASEMLICLASDTMMSLTVRQSGPHAVVRDICLRTKCLTTNELFHIVQCTLTWTPQSSAGASSRQGVALWLVAVDQALFQFGGPSRVVSQANGELNVVAVQVHSAVEPAVATLFLGLPLLEWCGWQPGVVMSFGSFAG